MFVIGGSVRCTQRHFTVRCVMCEYEWVHAGVKRCEGTNEWIKKASDI